MLNRFCEHINDLRNSYGQFKLEAEEPVEEFKG
jgi:hypothetical protein